MNVVILAAGFATRLYPLTLTQPKALLPVAGKPMVEYALDSLAGLEGLERICIVVNSRSADRIRAWAEHSRSRPQSPPLTLIDNGVTEDTRQRGAIADLALALEREHLDGDLIVVAGDNLFSASLAGFGTFSTRRGTPVIGIHDAGTLEQAKKYGVVETDPSGRLLRFEEKPAVPASTQIGVALYFLPRATLPLIHQYLAEGNLPDQPGRFIQWLCPKMPVHTWPVPGVWYDIGSRETLEEANRIFSKR